MDPEIWNYLLVPLQQFFALLFDGNVRHFWVYILTGMAIAMVAHRFSGDERSFWSVFFARDVWASRSAFNDYGMLVLNPVIMFVLLSSVLANFNILTGLIALGFRSAGVSGEVTDETAIFAGLGLTIALYVVNDFMRWFLHYLQHKSPLLWEFHKIHHSAEHLNFATAERFHPVDIAFSALGFAIAFALVNGVFIGLFGNQLTVVTAAGANALWFASNIIGGVLRHSPAWVSFGPKVEKWLISPAMHQIHHSNDPRHFDKNMGGSLAIWDRLAGTLYIPKGREVIGYGLGEESADYQTLTSLYLVPFQKVLGFTSNKSRTKPTEPIAPPAE